LKRTQINRLFRTLKYLKFKQLYFRIYYLIRNTFRKVLGYKKSLKKKPVQSMQLNMLESIPAGIYWENNSFVFLNKTYCFNQMPDWNFMGNGRLWNYYLNYFDFLLQRNIEVKDALSFVYNYIESLENKSFGLEPFPISLRGMNWIKFIIKYNIKDPIINSSLYAQYLILVDNLEYHILGNHLLENGFSLFFAAYYFNDKNFYAKAKIILIQELNEEILKDGCHFELSPMYHQIMLFRLLDCYNLLKSNPGFLGDELLSFFEGKLSMMCGFLDKISFRNGNVPRSNDTSFEMSHGAQELLEYAQRLQIKADSFPLIECGYRRFNYRKYEAFVDVGNIGPDYIPGHAHGDTFNFEIYFNEQPWIVEVGISTYEGNSIRLFERGTAAHNTVKIGDVDSSEVWGSFRVGRRAKIFDLTENSNSVSASHDGYKHIGIIHHRKFMFDENKMHITDTLSRSNKDAKAFIHFHPSAEVQLNKNEIFSMGNIIRIHGNKKIVLEKYNFASGFNMLEPAWKVIIHFDTSIEAEFLFN